MYFGENWISIDKDADYDKTLAAVARTVDGYPGMQRDVQTYLRERVKEVLTGTSGAIVVRVFGPEPKTLAELADGVVKRISDTPGLVETNAGLQKEIPQINIELDLEKARQYELKPGDIRRQSSALHRRRGGLRHLHRRQGLRRARLVDPVGARQLRRRQEPADRRARRRQDQALGRRRRLDRRRTPNAILREQQSRLINVEANVAEDADLGAAVDEVEDRMDGFEFPVGYHAEVVGEASELTSAQSRLGIFGIGAAIAIFLLLQAAFGSLRLAALAFLLLPISLVGGVLAVKLGSGILSLGSLVGFLTVFGIAARNGILMISHFQHLEHVERVPFGPELVLRGAKERLAPILMTALATGLAIVPLAYAGSIPGHEIEHPMAIVILGGLATSTLLNLFIIPSLYLRFAKSRSETRREAVAAPPQPAESTVPV